ncbi:MAG: sigma 54-interacting transcriptional regulator [Candidatus Aenigmarchaeota archaeon]|nr:sigma 54-interacting transcriptional regulator [Candidatus Aenigmarchaeota archaeon]
MNGSYSGMVAVSQAMAEVQRKIDLYAPLDTYVLILGETGTGKELVSREIHARSGRKEYRFEALNTGALPRELVESELFGYEQGAFTGATSRKVGYYELADNGTLFLDEIGNMPPETQVKLLRILDEGVFRRIGGVIDRQANVRIISATNNPDIYNAANFRNDLLYRLSVAVIEIPPLRERMDDITPIVNSFLRRWNERNGPEKTLNSHGLRLLTEYDYPGNVRELQNILERACVESPERTINPEVVQRILQEQKRHITHGKDVTAAQVTGLGYTESKRRFALNYMRELFESSGGNLFVAAKRLMDKVSSEEISRDLGYESLEQMIGGMKIEYKPTMLAEPATKTKHQGRRSRITDDELMRAIRQHGSFSKAAGELGVVGSAIDYRIKKMGYKGRKDFRKRAL